MLFFDGPNSLSLIDGLRPEFFVKARGDRGREIVEREAALVKKLGGQVIWDEAVFPCSSTSIPDAAERQHKTS